MEITIKKWSVGQNKFEVFAISLNDDKVADFLKDDRENFNSILTFCNMDFNSEMLISVAEAIKSEFGNELEFVLSVAR